MKKRVLSILLALCMALSLLPALAFAQQTVGQAATAEELTAALADSGSDVVQLTADIAITTGLKVRRNVTVDLNGYVLRYDEAADPDSIFRVAAGKTLTMTDSRPTATHEDAKLPAGGLITGGKGYWYDSTGGNGSVRIYHYYGGGVALMGFAELELGENARITGCTASEKDDAEEGTIEYGAAIYTDLEITLTVRYPGCFLYANGGRVEGTVYVGRNGNNEFATIKATNAIDHTDGKPTTVFAGDVYCEGDIRGGSFYGSVTAAISYYLDWDGAKNFWSNISGGSFYGPVRTEGYVSGGTFYGGLTLEKNAKLNGRPMNTDTEINDKTNIPDPNGEPVTVTYDYGELGGTYATQIVQAGETATRPDDPTKTGYTFAGWYRNGQAYDFDTPVTEDMTLTARWTANQYTIAFDTDGGSAVAPITQDYGTVIAAPAAPTREGYTFAGWDRELPATMPAQDMTLTAKWTVNSYTVTFTDGGSVLDTQTVPYGGQVTKPAALTKTGHTFGGWYLGEEEYDFATPVTEDLTLTAFWFTDLYTITFDSAGGTPIMPITQDYGAAISAPADPKKTGYVFAGWDQAFPATMPAENLTLTARWTLCSHMGSAAHPTCTKGAVCTLCGEDLPAAGHEYTWQSGGGQYWQQCSVCTQETAKKPIPQLTISGADRVCRTQDYTFSFILPQSCQDPTYGYDFGLLGDGGLEAELESGVYSAAITTDSYDAATGFRVIVSAQTEDGFVFTVTKDVAIVDGHLGGTATCTEKAVCEICGESYGDLNAGHHGDLRHVPARAATTDAEGNIEYWYCGGCHKYYADAAATRDLTQADTVTAKLPNPETPPTPSTGDGGATLWITLLLFSGALAGVAVTKKRKHSKNA